MRKGIDVDVPRADIRAIRRGLLRWYAKHRRDLPWRQTRDPFHIWVSEAMLQQTRVDTAIPYYERFVARFPDVQALSRADVQDVLKLWEGLGYYARARNLQRAAGIVVDRHKGIVPQNREDLLDLPGIGSYMAAAIVSIAFDLPEAVVDGNVKRVLARVFRLTEPVNDSRSHATFDAFAGALLDVKQPGAFNQAMMELGALVCRPGKPLCSDCPIASRCGACLTDAVSLYPKRLVKKRVPEKCQVTGIVLHRGKLLIIRRPAQGLLGGLWEFPGGPVFDTETGEDACRRIIRELTSLEVGEEKKIGQIRHVYSHFKLTADVFLCRKTGGRVRLHGADDHCWVSPDQLSAYPLHKAQHKCIPLLMKEIFGG